MHNTPSTNNSSSLKQWNTTKLYLHSEQFDDQSLVNFGSNKPTQRDVLPMSINVSEFHAISQSTKESSFLNVQPSRAQILPHCDGELSLIQLEQLDQQFTLISTHDELFKLDSRTQYTLLPMDIMIDLLKSCNYNNQLIRQQASIIDRMERQQRIYQSKQPQHYNSIQK